MMVKICIGNLFVSFLVWGLMVSGTAYAQVKPINKDAPRLVTEVSLTSADNFNPTLSEKDDAYGMGVGASGQLVATGEGNWLQLSYAGKLERFKLSDSANLLSDDYDFVSYDGGILGRLFLAKAWYLDAELRHSKEDERFGFGLSYLREDVLFVDERTENQGSINLVYGSDASNRSISFKIASADVSYADVNPYSTLFDYQQQSFGLNVAFRQSSLTRLLLNFEAKDDNYDSDARDDSRLYNLLLGIDWQPTGKSKLRAMLGAFRREQAEGETSSGLSWNLDYQYQARQDLLFSLRSSRLSAVGRSEFASDSVNSTVAADATYLYSEQWQLGANFAFERSEYDDELVSQVLDEQVGKIRLALLLKQHNKLELDLVTRQVSSDDDSIDYRQNEVKLSWRYTF